ncbi:MAG TPA: acetate--CoA ligase family protein [Candidatus Deferrimicrobium sp.]|nr:acetate--CoA ligase family protein [Candidatus Deferrimicrobium sp.]
MSEIVKKIIKTAVNENRTALMEHESKEIMNAYGIGTSKEFVVNSADEAVKAAQKIGFPIVAKIVSPDILHKTDAGGIKLNLKSDAEVKQAYEEILKSAKAYKADAKIIGINIQEMARAGITEVIVGLTTDPQFGPALMFGLGGIFVEIYKDVSFRVCPITEYDAREMIEEIKAYPILNGFRGRPLGDVDTLVNILLKSSQLALEFPEIDQMDLNPIIVYEKGKGCAVVDARIILKEKK